MFFGRFSEELVNNKTEKTETEDVVGKELSKMDLSTLRIEPIVLAVIVATPGLHIRVGSDVNWVTIGLIYQHHLQKLISPFVSFRRVSCHISVFEGFAK